MLDPAVPPVERVEELGDVADRVDAVPGRAEPIEIESRGERASIARGADSKRTLLRPRSRIAITPAIAVSVPPSILAPVLLADHAKTPRAWR